MPIPHDGAPLVPRQGLKKESSRASPDTVSPEPEGDYQQARLALRPVDASATRVHAPSAGGASAKPTDGPHSELMTKHHQIKHNREVVKIQTVARGKLARNHAGELRAKKHEKSSRAAVRLQRRLRGHQSRRVLAKQQTAAGMIQKGRRGMVDKRDFRSARADRQNRQEAAHQADYKTLSDSLNQDRETRDAITDTGAFVNEGADAYDAAQDHLGLKNAEGIYAQHGVSDHAGLEAKVGSEEASQLLEDHEGATQGVFGQVPGDAEAGYDGHVGAAGAAAEGLEAFANHKDLRDAQQRLAALQQRQAQLQASDPDDHSLDSQIKVVEDTIAMAKRRRNVAMAGVAMKGAEGIQHYALSGTSMDPIGVTAVSEAYAAVDEGRRARDAYRHNRKLANLNLEQSNRGSDKTEMVRQQVAAKRKQIESGKATDDTFHQLDQQIGSNSAEVASSNAFKHQRRLMVEADVAGIHKSATTRQAVKAGLAGTAAAGHAASAVGSVTGGTDLGVIKAAGTTVTAGTGLARTGLDIRERYRDNLRLGYAKNYADSNRAQDGKSQKVRGKAWAAGHVVADVAKVLGSNVVMAGGLRGSPAEYRAQSGHRTMDESAANLREQVLSAGSTPQNQAGAKYRRQGHGLTATQAHIIADLASRQTRKDASTLVDAAGHRGYASQAAIHNAKGTLDALGVGLGAGSTDETYGADSDESANALKEAYQQRHALRR